jgi:vacuolar-type H+-ATPase subunit C/Vma6
LSQTQEAIDKLEKQLDKKYYYNTNSNHQYDKLEKSIKNTIVSSQLEYERKLKIKDDEITAFKK